MNSVESQVNLPAPVEGSLPLARGRDEMFARLRARGLSIQQAACEAGFVVSPENARRKAQNPKIKERIAWLTRCEEDVLAEQRRVLMERQWLWHESDIADFFERGEEPVIRDGDVVLNRDGSPLMRMVERLKPLDRLTREQRLCIDGITWTERGKPNLKLYSKSEANKELRKLLGLDRPHKVAVTDPEGKELPTTADRARALAAFIAETQAEMAAMDAAKENAG